MTWLVLAGGTALFYALQGAWTKRLTREVSQMEAAWAIFAFSLPALALYLIVKGLPEVQPAFWPALAVNAVLSLASFYLYVTALHRGDLGLTYPLLALTPILLVPVEWILLGTRPGLQGLAGILLVVAGVYLLNYGGGEGGLLAPFRAVARDSGARRMLGVAAIWAVSGVIDKVAVLHSSPGFYGTTLSAALALGFLPLVWREGSRPARPTSLRRLGLLLVQGLLFAAMFVCQMEALRLTLAAYVITLKRSGALLSVLLGSLFFEEARMGQRLAGTVVIVLGVLLVALS